MPELSRRFVKAAIVFLVFGLLLGLHIAAASYAGWGTLRRPYVVAHTHLLLVGFLLMMVMGVASWMFPRRANEPTASAARRARGGHTRAAELAWWLVTSGVIARATFEIVSAYSASRWVGVAAFASACVEVVGIVVFFVDLWPRIRSPREELERRSGR